MPLRAKQESSDSRQWESKSSTSSTSQQSDSKSLNKKIVIRELKNDNKEDVLFNTNFGVRSIELHRPSKHNTLSASMIRKIVPRLLEWEKSDMANAIIIKGSGPVAFCAGGDVVELAKQNLLGEKEQAKSADYFALEYRLNHLIATYTKPYIAFIDGYTMGGGVGLSIHAPIRIATERTVFAMPETRIGFFPDVGASFFLPRLDGSVGTYLALTGENLKGVDVFYTGIATHYIHSTSLYPLELRLAELRFKDYETLAQRLDLINSTVEEFATGLPHDQKMTIADERRKAIDRCFNKNSVVEIFDALKAETQGVNRDWASKTIATLRENSPTSLFVSLRLMKLGKKWSIAEALKREYLMANRFMHKSDFNEGVHALLIRKDKTPKWESQLVTDINREIEIADPYMYIEGSQSISLLNDTDFLEYPHNYGLPSEEAVKNVATDPKIRLYQVVDYFVKSYRGKQGVKQKVEEIITRNAATWRGGSLV